jgi:flagellar basal body-associated protein FliL
MLTGFYLYQMIAAMKTKGEKLVFRIISSIIALILLALPVALYIFFFREKQVSFLIFIFATVCSWSLCIFIFHSLFGKKGVQPSRVFVGIILTMIMITSVYMIPIGRMFLNEERNSIRILRDNKDIAELDFYYNEKEELRMELVYEANRRFYKMNPEDDAAIEKALPFVFVSGESIEKLMSPKKVTVEFIGIFDNNWKKKGDKYHNPDLVREVAIIRAK